MARSFRKEQGKSLSKAGKGKETLDRLIGGKGSNLLDWAPYGAIIASRRLDGPCLYINKAFTSITGYEHGDINCVKDWIELAYPDPSYRRYVLEQWNTDASPKQMERDVIYIVKTKEGKEKHIQFRASSLDEEHMIVMLVDQSKQIETQKALDDSKRGYSELLRELPLGLLLHRQGRIIFANRASADLFGAERADDLLGLEPEDLLRPQDAKRARERQRAIASGKTLAKAEYDAYSLDGNKLRLRASSKALLYNGEAAILTLFENISESRELEGKMLRAEKEQSLSLMSAGIAHDLNNLLVGVMGNAELAQEDIPPDSDLFGDLRRIVLAAQRAGDLSRQLLIYAGRVKLSHEVINLTKLLDDMYPLLQSSKEEKVEVRYQGPEEELFIEGDSTSIRQVIMNLVINAKDALYPSGGRVDVSLYADEGENIDGRESFAVIRISDNGCGMTEDVIRQIFDPFFTTKTEGRGLGLAAVQGVVRSHRGDIRVQSEAFKGTTIDVLFPLGESSRAVSALKRLDSPRPQGEGAKVLLIDDESTIRDFAGVLLQRLGFEVVTARDSTMGLKHFEREVSCWSLVILDLHLPRENGVRVAQIIRNEREEIPIVFISGDEAPPKAVVEDRNSAFLSKPFGVNDFTRTIENLLNGS